MEDEDELDEPEEEVEEPRQIDEDGRRLSQRSTMAMASSHFLSVGR